MNILRYTDAGFAQRVRELAAASSLFDPAIEQRTRAILEDVRTRGDEALLELTERFDGAKLSAEQLPVDPGGAGDGLAQSRRNTACGDGRGGRQYRGVRPEVAAQGPGRPATRTARRLARSSTRFSASASIFPGERRRWFQRP